MGVGHGATTDSLDPATYPDQFTGTMGWGSISNSLTEMNAKGEVVPDLAESLRAGGRCQELGLHPPQGRRHSMTARP